MPSLLIFNHLLYEYIVFVLTLYISLQEGYRRDDRALEGKRCGSRKREPRRPARIARAEGRRLERARCARRTAARRGRSAARRTAALRSATRRSRSGPRRSRTLRPLCPPPPGPASAACPAYEPVYYAYIYIMRVLL